MGAITPSGYEDQYPYEKLTDTETANIQRMRDSQMRKLRREHQAALDELHVARKQLAAVRAAGIDPDVLISSQRVFKED